MHLEHDHDCIHTHDHPHTHEQETIQNAFACIKMTRTAFYQCGFDFYMSFSA